MKTEKNILWAFILNLAFSIFEFIGGIITGSVAILSDSLHDIGDATSIGAAFFLEKKSKRAADAGHTYGYARFSVMGGALTSLILLLGSLAVVYSAIMRIISPVEINYNGMIIFALIGVCINLAAAFLTRDGGSINQRAVNLHMLEDVLGWIVVLIGAVVMRFTDFYLIDPIMSICVAIFILINALGNLREVLDILLEKTPRGVDADELCEHISALWGVSSVHHIHIWTLDGQNNCATMHISAEGEPREVKARIRQELSEHGIGHVTIEIDDADAASSERYCQAAHTSAGNGHHHHHHHHGRHNDHDHRHNDHDHHSDQDHHSDHDHHHNDHK